MPRDSQQAKLYRAENGAFEYVNELGSVRDAQRYANTVTGSRWWRALGGPPFVLVKAARSDAKSSRANGQAREIVLAPNHFARWVILHELAHVAIWHLAKNRQAHGPEYALLYRRMVEEYLGEHWGVRLRLEFEFADVKDATTDQRVLKALAAAEGVDR